MIRFAEEKDIGDIFELWNIAFPEEPDFNKYFFENIFDYKNTLITVKNNELAAMAQLLPYEIENIGNVTYIYGAATKPEYRKRGLMGELLKRSFEIDIERGKSASILIPANKPLFDFYKRIGYEIAFYADRKVYKAGEKCAEIKEALFDDIPKLMNIYCGNIIRSEEYWKTQLKMYNSLGGRVFLYGSAYAVVSDKIEEIMFKDIRDKEMLINSVCRHLKCSCVEVIEKGKDTPVGMIKKHREFNTEKLYMNLMYN